MIGSGNLVTDFFLDAEGLAPNSYQATMQALSFVEGLPQFEKIADIGCGTGQQTSTLYEATNAQIIAIDFILEFVEYLKNEAKIQKLDGRIHSILASADNLPFDNEELDLVWAESVVNEIGFEYALKQWNKYIKKGGYIGLCSYCWLTDDPPGIIAEYWKNTSKEIEPISCRIKQILNNGFIPVAHFIMPDECWWNYFCPMEDNFDRFLEKHPDDFAAKKLIEQIDKEISLFERYGECYGYVFFIGKKVDN